MPVNFFEHVRRAARHPRNTYLLNKWVFLTGWRGHRSRGRWEALKGALRAVFEPLPF